jgi:hypothetical protein
VTAKVSLALDMAVRERIMGSLPARENVKGLTSLIRILFYMSPDPSDLFFTPRKKLQDTRINKTKAKCYACDSRAELVSNQNFKYGLFVWVSMFYYHCIKIILFESKNYFLQFYYFILKAFFFCF